MLYLNLKYWKHGLPRGGGKFLNRGFWTVGSFWIGVWSEVYLQQSTCMQQTWASNVTQLVEPSLWKMWKHQLIFSHISWSSICVQRGSAVEQKCSKKNKKFGQWAHFVKNKSSLSLEIQHLTSSWKKKHMTPCWHIFFGIFWGYPRPTNSGVCEGLVRGPFINMNRLLFYWHRGAWGIPPHAANVLRCCIHTYQKIHTSTGPGLNFWKIPGPPIPLWSRRNLRMLEIK